MESFEHPRTHRIEILMGVPEEISEILKSTLENGKTILPSSQSYTDAVFRCNLIAKDDSRLTEEQLEDFLETVRRNFNENANKNYYVLLRESPIPNISIEEVPVKNFDKTSSDA